MSQQFVPQQGSDALVEVDAESESETVILPGGFAAGRKFIVRRVDTSVYAVTVAVPFGGRLNGAIDGTSSIQRGSEIDFVSRGAGLWSSFGGGSSNSGGGVTSADLSASVATRANLSLSNVTPAQGRASLGLGTAAVANLSTLTVAQAQVSGLSTALSGKADLDPTTGKIPSALLPPLAIGASTPVGSQAAMLALSAQQGDMAIRTDLGKTFVLSTNSPTVLADWLEIVSSDGVATVAGKTGTVTLVQSDISGLPAALTAKANAADVTTALAGKAATTDLDAKADDADVVKLAGTQTIAGPKTFSDPPVVPAATTTTQAAQMAQMRQILIWDGATYGDKVAPLAECVGPVEPNDTLLTLGSITPGDAWQRVDVA